MKRILLLLISFLSLGLGFGQIISEGFTAGSLPAGWTQSNVTFTTSAGGYANFTSTTAVLTSPTFNASTFTSIDVDFDVAKFGSGTNGPVTLEYSLNGGSTWIIASNSTTPTGSTYQSNSINIASVSATMKIRITRGGSQSAKRFRNLVITGVGTATVSCSITSLGLSNVSCDNNSTIPLFADDKITFDLNPTGTGLGATYNVTVSGALNSVTPTSGTYGAVTSFEMQGGSAGAGNVTVTITDVATGTCTDNVLLTDPGTCSAPPTPTITVTPNTLTGLDYTVGSGPSAAQSFDVEGIALLAGIDISAPTGFLISKTSGGPYTSTLNIPLLDANGTNTIYVILESGLAINTYSGNITMTNLTTGITTLPSVAVSGEVSAVPTGCVSIFSDDFSGTLTQWSNTSDWTIASGELKHNLSGTSGSSYIYSDLGAQDLTTKNYEWSFCIGNGNWDPYGSNNFLIF